MFKYTKDLVPPPIVELFTRNYEFHNHFTGQSQWLHTAVGRNEAIYKTFTFHVIRIWNYISTKISVDASYASFKHSSKLCIFHANLYVNLFNLISFTTFINLVLQ